MSLDSVLQLAGQFGPMGLMVAYLIYKDTRADTIAKDRIAADLKIAEALTLMRATMEGMRHVR